MHRNDRLMIMLGLAVTIVALIGAAVGGRPKLEDFSENQKVDFTDWPIRDSGVKHTTSTLTENSDETIIVLINESYVTKVLIELNWLDEAPTTMRHENQPDTFNFTVYTPWEAVVSSDDVENTIGQAGQIQEEITTPEDGIKINAAKGEWRINIHCGNCGDQILKRPGLGLFNIEDTGNAWELSYTYWFHSNTVQQ